MKVVKLLHSGGIRGVPQAVKHSSRSHIQLTNVSKALSTAPEQTDAGPRDFTWAQYLLKATAGFGFAAGSFALLSSHEPAHCEQQASAGQTVVCLRVSCVSTKLKNFALVKLQDAACNNTILCWWLSVGVAVVHVDAGEEARNKAR